MATELIPIGANAANSADFDLADGAAANVFLKGEENGTSNEMVVIEMKDEAGGYTVIATLGTSLFGVNIAGPGTFRARRLDGLGKTIGVSRG